METEEDLNVYLSGSDPLLNRLEYAKKAFVAPIAIPSTQKEDVVILWLTRLLTKKPLQQSSNEFEAAWKTLEEILSSPRLEALCEAGWMCPIDTSFTEMLVSNLKTTPEAEEEMDESNAIRIAHIIIGNKHLAPLITRRPSQCLDFLEGLLDWMTKDHKSNADISAALIVTAEVNIYLKYHADKKNALMSVVQHLLLPTARLNHVFKNDERDTAKSLLLELNALIKETLFNEEVRSFYHETLELIFAEETKVALSGDAERVFNVLVKALSNEDVEVSEHLLHEFFLCFALTYKDHDDMSYKMFVVLCFMIGVTVKGSSILMVSKNNLACRPISAANCDPVKQEKILLSLLLAAKNCHFSHDSKLENIVPTNWLQNLSVAIVNNGLQTACGCKCLQILLQLNPKKMMHLITNNFMGIISKCMKPRNSEIAVEVTDTDGVLHTAIDDLLCDVLEAYNKTGEIPNMLVSIIHCMLKKPKLVAKCAVIPKSLHIYEGNLLFPPRFMFSILKHFNTMRHTNVIATWKVFLSLINEHFSKFMEDSANRSQLKLVGVAVWLLSCILKSFPLLEIVSIAGVAPDIAELMNQTGNEVIKPLISSMLTHPHNNDLCGSLLSLCHTWGELRIRLCEYPKYFECQGVSAVQMPDDSQQATDFSYLLPFISSDMWSQISARISNFGNQPTQLALVQLVLQKLSNVIHCHQNNMDIVDVRCDEESMSSTSKIIEASTKYLLNAVDTWDEGVMQIFAVHITYLLPYFHDVHLPTIAKYIVNGYIEEKSYWKSYVHSGHFLEAFRLYPHILACLCSTLIANVSSRKRKISETEEDSVPRKNYVKKIFTKLGSMGSVPLQNGISNYENTRTVLSECGPILAKLIDSKRKPHESCSCLRNLSAIIGLFKRFPYSHLNLNNQTEILFVLLTLMVNDEFNSKEEQYDILQTITGIFLRNQKSLLVSNMFEVDILVKWLIKKKLSLTTYMLSPKIISVNEWYQKDQSLESKDPLDTLISQEVDLLLRSILDHEDCIKKTDYLQNLVDYITTSEDFSAAEDTRLHIAVVLLSVFLNKTALQPKGKDVAHKESCQVAFQMLSSWILRILKKIDLSTVDSATAANLLIGHVIILKVNYDVFEKPKDSAKDQDTNETKPEGENGTTNDTPSKIKTPKYKKLVERSIKLSELCLSSSNPHLVEHALHFLSKIGECASHLETYLPQNLFINVWSALNHHDYLSAKGKCNSLARVCLLKLMPIATPEEFNKMLKDLLRRTQSPKNIPSSLVLWKVVLAANLSGKNANLKRLAVKHLISLLVNFVNLRNLETSLPELLIPVTETVKAISGAESIYSTHSRALALKYCMSLQLRVLPLHQFDKIFKMAVKIVHGILKNQSEFALQRIPLILEAIGHFAEVLVAQSSQDHNLEEKDIIKLGSCGNHLESLVKLLMTYKKEVRPVIHFTVARIVVALQLTVIYKDIKSIMEIIVYHLLDICDEHGLNHLLVALPPVNTSLLKHLQKNYKEYYKFCPGNVRT